MEPAFTRGTASRAGTLTDAQKREFWRRLKAGKDKKTGCWYLKPDQPFIYASYFSIPAHRLAHFLTTGKLSDDEDVLHSCDNHGCANPKHLRAGTASDNTNDAYARGRYHKPENGRSGRPPEGHRVTSVHARLFHEDVRKLKQIAAQKLIPWQTELRLLVHRALDVKTVTGDEP